VRVLELSLRNYRVFEQVDLEFPARVIGIFGPNGAGKSALVGSMLFALFGVDRTAKDQIRTHGLLTDCEVRLAFEHGGQQYEVRRIIKGRNHQTEAELLIGDLELAVGVREVSSEIARLLRMDQRIFRASVFAEQKQLDAFSDITKGDRKKMVLRLLGIKPVEDAIAAARKEARARKAGTEEMAGSLPDLAEQEAALGAAKELQHKASKVAEEAARDLGRASKLFEKLDAAFGASEETRRKAEQLEAVRTQAAAQAEALDRRHEELGGRIEELASSLKPLPGLEKELKGLAGSAEHLVAARRFSEAAEELRAAEAEMESLAAPDAEAALEELRAATGAVKGAEKAFNRAESVLEQAEVQLAVAEEALERAGHLDATEPCPTCGQELGAAYEDVIAHRKKEVTALKKSLTGAKHSVGDKEAELKSATSRFAAAEDAGKLAQRAITQREVLEKKATARRKQVAELGKPWTGKVPDLDELEARAARAEELDREVTGLRAERKHLAQAEKDHAATAKEREAASKNVADLERRLGELGFDPKAHEKLRADREEAAADLERARREEREVADQLKDAQKEVARLEAGIEQVKELAVRIDEAREEARYVDRVSLLLGGFRDHLVARIGPELSREAEAIFRELTNHEYEDLKIDEDDLSIQIADAGTYFPTERFSGSEVDLANLALRVAISQHLSRMAGADLGMMVLDEVMGSLDAERKDLFVQAIGRLSGHFHQLFVITHAEQVKDQFPASVEIRKTGRRRSEAVLV
jgi:exonuclease SbcC